MSQENHYYPFGMNLKGVALNTAPAERVSQRQYNGGSRLEDELTDDEVGTYATPYRTYDPTIGRFQGADPLADEFANQTPAGFAGNYPVNANDPSGAVTQSSIPGWMSQRDGYNANAYRQSLVFSQDYTYGQYRDNAQNNGSVSPWSAGEAMMSDRKENSENLGLVAALNAFVPGLNAAWNSNHHSFGYYSSFGGTEGAESGNHTRDVLLQSPIIGMKFNSLSFGGANHAYLVNNSKYVILNAKWFASR